MNVIALTTPTITEYNYTPSTDTAEFKINVGRGDKFIIIFHVIHTNLTGYFIIIIVDFVLMFRLHMNLQITFNNKLTTTKLTINLHSIMNCFMYLQIMFLFKFLITNQIFLQGLARRMHVSNEFSSIRWQIINVCLPLRPRHIRHDRRRHVSNAIDSVNIYQLNYATTSMVSLLS